jgi:alpha-glucosidase (family GH31 glycosyl hydrolase)
MRDQLFAKGVDGWWLDAPEPEIGGMGFRKIVVQFIVSKLLRFISFSVHGRFPSPIRPGQVAHAKTVLRQNPARKIRALSAQAMHDNFLFARQFVHAGTNLVQRNVNRAGNEPFRTFVRAANVEQDGLLRIK